MAAALRVAIPIAADTVIVRDSGEKRLARRPAAPRLADDAPAPTQPAPTQPSPTPTRRRAAPKAQIPAPRSVDRGAQVGGQEVTFDRHSSPPSPLAGVAADEEYEERPSTRSGQHSDGAGRAASRLKPRPIEPGAAYP